MRHYLRLLKRIWLRFRGCIRISTFTALRPGGLVLAIRIFRIFQNPPVLYMSLATTDGRLLMWTIRRLRTDSPLILQETQNALRDFEKMFPFPSTSMLPVSFSESLMKML